MSKKPAPKSKREDSHLEDSITPKPLEKINFKKRGFKFSEKQKQFLDVALDQDTKVVFLAGPSGSAKTFMSVYAALALFPNIPDAQIMYVRSIAESAEKGLGSLPGEAEEKFCPFTAPLYDKIEEIVSDEHTVWLSKNNKLVAMPINYLRGASWINKIVINDEAQNLSYKELTTLITRLGEGSKLFICGDFMQSDIKSSGFEPMFDLFNDEESKSKGIHCFKFDVADIFRSEVLKYIITKLQSKKPAVSH